MVNWAITVQYSISILLSLISVLWSSVTFPYTFLFLDNLKGVCTWKHFCWSVFSEKLRPAKIHFLFHHFCFCTSKSLNVLNWCHVITVRMSCCLWYQRTKQAYLIALLATLRQGKPLLAGLKVTRSRYIMSSPHLLIW